MRSMAQRPPLAVHRGARIRATEVDLHADLRMPDGAWGAVVLADEGSRSEQDPGDRTLAEQLADRGIGSLALTTLTKEERAQDELTGALRFNADLLSRRVVAAFRWLQTERRTEDLPLGLVGIGTIAAAALEAAAQLEDEVSAIVCIDGRPDLAVERLSRVAAPTVFIVSEDTDVRAINEAALREIPVEKELTVVPGHGRPLTGGLALQETGKRTADWLERFLTRDVG